MRPWLWLWLKWPLVGVSTFGACWLGAVGYWRETLRMPSSDDLVLYMLVLPLLMLAVIAVAIWTARKLLAASAVSTAAVAAAGASAPEGGATGVAALAAVVGGGPAATAPSLTTLAILAGALRLPHGANAAQLSASLASRRVSLKLDSELKNDDGYPILAGRIDEVDAEAQAQAGDMAEWLAEHHPQVRFEAEQWRALALGSSITASLALELAPHPALPAYREAVAAGKPLPPLPQLQVLTLMPPEWAPAEQQAGADWLRQLVVYAGWPAARVAPAPNLAVASSQPPLAQLAQVIKAVQLAQLGQISQPGEPGQPTRLSTPVHAAPDSDQPLLCLIIACHSRIGADSVQDWANQAMLFDSDHPHGRIPGEGAAGLLLADQAQAALFNLADTALLYPPCIAMRADSADGKARGDNALLAQLAGQALHAGHIAPAIIANLVSDSDQRASRMTELLGMASQVLPELDTSDVLNVTAACGDAGAVSTIAALVLAQQQIKAGAGAALCVSNLDPFLRAAVLLIAATPTAVS